MKHEINWCRWPKLAWKIKEFFIDFSPSELPTTTSFIQAAEDMHVSKSSERFGISFITMGGGGGAIAYRHNGYQVRASRGWHNEIMKFENWLAECNQTTAKQISNEFESTVI
jgi:hypothetical protein